MIHRLPLPTRIALVAIAVLGALIIGQIVQAEQSVEQGFAHFYFVANPAQSPRVQEPNLYTKKLRRLPTPHVVPVFRSAESKTWMIRDTDCSELPTPLDSRYSQNCLRYSGWRGQPSDDGGMEWLPDILPAVHMRYVVSPMDTRTTTYLPQRTSAQDSAKLSFSTDQDLIRAVHEISSELLREELGSQFNFDSGHCFVLAALLKHRLRDLIPELRVRYIHLWNPKAVNSDQAMRLLQRPDRARFLGRQQIQPIPFRYHTALVIEGFQKNWVLDPTASDALVDLQEWPKLFATEIRPTQSAEFQDSTGLQIEFRDQVHFQLDLSAHLSVQVFKAERLLDLGFNHWDATDWVTLTDLGPTSLWPSYLIQGYGSGGVPDRVDFKSKRGK